jgi:hypothetical protein
MIPQYVLLSHSIINNHMRQQHVLRDHAKMPEANAGEYALGIGGRLSTNPLFTSLVSLGGAITAKATEFNLALGVSLTGSATDRAHKNTVRGQLNDLLDDGANAVDNLAQGDVEILTASGFHLTHPAGPTPAPVGTVALTGLANVAPTKLGLVLTVSGNVWTVIAERQNADATWTKVAVFTDLNNTVVTGLVSGSTNTFRVCAMAAANQTSEWSAPMSAICT